MGLTIQLLGRPEIRDPRTEPYRIRGKKTWALLAYVLLGDRPYSRRHLAMLLFENADDPLRALRWSVAEVRKALDPGGDIRGDPVVLDLADDASVDVRVLTSGTWDEAVKLPGLGKDLLEGFAIRDSAAFEAWLLSERSHLGAASEAILHEAALVSLSRGEWTQAIDYARRVVAMNPLEENHQALLIRSFKSAGDHRAAAQQLESCTELFVRELGVAPGPAVRAAAESPSLRAEGISDGAAIEAILESGSAAISAGAVESGVSSLRAGVALADSSSNKTLMVKSRLFLAEALIHSLRGEDEEGTTILHQANQIAEEEDELSLSAQANVELGYVDFLRARYDRAEHRLQRALDAMHSGHSGLRAKANAYLGAVASDRADYQRTFRLLAAAVDIASQDSAVRTGAYAHAVLGRAHLLRGDLAEAADALQSSIGLALEERWLAFLPWPQSFLAEVHLKRGDADTASEILEQAFARACQIGDPCWEGVSARGLALVAAAEHDTERAFDLLDDARIRCDRLADTYMWLEAYILDTQCTLGTVNNHPQTKQWVDAMHELAARTGMKEMTARALIHKSHLGDESAATMASLMVSEIDNPVLDHLSAG